MRRRAGLASVGDSGDRIRLDGPRIRLDAQVTLALTFALHAFATKACKYGALSNDAGAISLTRTHQPVEDSTGTRFTLLWQESGGPAVARPDHKGLGSKMIELSLRTYFRAGTSLNFDAKGVAFRIDAPLPKTGVAAG